MKHYPAILLSCALLLGSCGHDHDEHGHSGSDVHYHAPPHGGVLVELGEHGFRIQPRTLSRGPRILTQIFVWDAHADNLVRIEQENADLLILRGQRHVAGSSNNDRLRSGIA